MVYRCTLVTSGGKVLNINRATQSQSQCLAKSNYAADLCIRVIFSVIHETETSHTTQFEPSVHYCTTAARLGSTWFTSWTTRWAAPGG